jgi:hypothetical protein
VKGTGENGDGEKKEKDDRQKRKHAEGAIIFRTLAQLKTKKEKRKRI